MFDLRLWGGVKITNASLVIHPYGSRNDTLRYHFTWQTCYKLLVAGEPYYYYIVHVHFELQLK
jgi:hypothetical protein